MWCSSNVKEVFHIDDSTDDILVPIQKWIQPSRHCRHSPHTIHINRNFNSQYIKSQEHEPNVQIESYVATKILLFWLLDTRYLLISLPNRKCSALSNELQSIITKNSYTYHDLESLVGCLNHVMNIIPTDCQSLNRLRQLLQKSRYKRQVNIHRLLLANLLTWKDFLHQANNDITMHLLVFRELIHIYQSDLCEHGLGGYSTSGIVRQWELPTSLLACAHINFLEFLSSIVCIWLEFFEKQIFPSSCLLAMCNSITPAGWLRK